MFWVAALAYRVVASTLFAQIPLLFVVKSAFDSFFAPTFRAFKFFIHMLILQRISNFSNARKRYINKLSQSIYLSHKEMAQFTLEGGGCYDLSFPS